MSTYGSPSLRKMEGTFGRRERPRQKFSLGRILGDPFALATISISILAWLIAFVASIIADVNGNSSDPTHGYPNYAWWAVVYYLCVIVGVTVAIAADAVFTYHVAIVGFLSYGLFLSTTATNYLVYSPNGAQEAASAGFILLSIIAIVWMFYFGSQPQASHRNFIDSFALHKGTDGPSTHVSRHMSNNQFGNQNPSYMNNAQPQNPRNHLTGFETSSPTPQFSAPLGGDSRGSPAQQNQAQKFGSPKLNQPQTMATPHNYGNGGQQEEAPTQTEYPYKARAIYSYEANPDDANEISFQKHEILEVSDVSGRWWQAKKANAETGIAPSNYLILL